MKKLIIIGAGGHGRELLEWVIDINKEQLVWEILGFLDDNENALQGTNCKYKIIGKIGEWEKYKQEAYFSLGISSPILKEKITIEMLSKDAKFASIVHPTARIAENACCGMGLVAYPNSYICSNAKVGNFVTLLSSKISHDCIVGDYSTILSYCGLNGNTVVGKRVFIGNHATMVQGLTIGDDVSIGIGSVVLKDIPSNMHVFGNPARIYKKGE